MSNNAHDLSKRLLNALDNSYNVVDMQAVNEIISILEKFNITKELLETTRLGKHVNELRRKTTDPTLARRAKVLVKRWRDLVIPGSTTSPAHTSLPGSNRSSAERQVRRLGGTPLTSPALSRVLSPAVSSPRPPSRPAWGGYESDSQDVILVDDDGPPPLPPPLSNTTPTKRPTSPTPLSVEKKTKRDKKPKKRRGHSRAGSGGEAEGWAARNGASPGPPAPQASPVPHGPHARKNGCRPAVDAYSALVNRMPPAGSKKVKTTKELLVEIQSRGGSKPVSEPASPGSPDVMLIEPEVCPVKVESPLRNGDIEPRVPSPPRAPLEDHRDYHECTCGEEPDSCCPASRTLEVRPLHIRALHHAYLPGINGTRAPIYPHQFAVRKPTDPDNPGLFTSVVPLYKYSDYADDYCVKNLSQVPLCTHLPWTEFAPPPPSPPPLKSPPSPRPYPIEEPKPEESDKSDDEPMEEVNDVETEISTYKCPKIEAEMVGIPKLEPVDRLKAPILSVEDEELVIKNDLKCEVKMDVESDFVSEQQEHRTVERTKVNVKEKCDIDGRTLYKACEETRLAIPFDYSQASITPVVTLPLDENEAAEVLEEALQSAVKCTERAELDRPIPPSNFTEWHECAKLGDLIALPYVVID